MTNVIYTCPTCSKHFNTKYALSGHKRIHSPIVIDKIENNKLKKKSNLENINLNTELFSNNKYTRWYFEIIRNNQNIIHEGYFEKHHIIPRSLGGSDNQNNIIKLTAREHFICHWLLTKTVKKNSNHYYSLYKAYNMMTLSSNNHERYNITSNVYNTIKKTMSKIKSETLRGKNNPSYGTKWITNFKTKSIKMVKKEELSSYLDSGWKLGKIENFDLYDDEGNKTKLIVKSKTLKELSSYQEFIDFDEINLIIANNYDKISTRELSKIVNISHVAISHRVKILKKLSTHY